MTNSNPFEGIFEAYSSLTDKVLALIVFVLCSLSLLALYFETSGPFDLIKEGLQGYIDNPQALPLLKTLATILLNLVNVVLNYKPNSYYFGLLLVTVIIYGTLSVTVSAGLTFLFLEYSTKTTVISGFFITQLFYIYNYISYGWQRMLIALIAVVVYFIGVDEFLKMMNYTSVKNT